MKGRAATLEQKHFHSVLAENIGCIACAKDGMLNTHVSIHHVDGRTKPNAHWLVLPLCGPHHQDAGIPGFIAVHPWKARFEAKYGRQLDLVTECISILMGRGCIVPRAALVATNYQKTNPVTAPTVPGLQSHKAKGAVQWETK